MKEPNRKFCERFVELTKSKEKFVDFGSADIEMTDDGISYRIPQGGMWLQEDIYSWIAINYNLKNGNWEVDIEEA